MLSSSVTFTFFIIMCHFYNKKNKKQCPSDSSAQRGEATCPKLTARENQRCWLPCCPHSSLFLLKKSISLGVPMKHPENATCRHLSGIHGIGLMGFRVGPEPAVETGWLSQGQGRFGLSTWLLRETLGGHLWVLERPLEPIAGAG